MTSVVTYEALVILALRQRCFKVILLSLLRVPTAHTECILRPTLIVGKRGWRCPLVLKVLLDVIYTTEVMLLNDSVLVRRNHDLTLLR